MEPCVDAPATYAPRTSEGCMPPVAQTLTIDWKPRMMPRTTSADTRVGRGGSCACTPVSLRAPSCPLSAPSSDLSSVDLSDTSTFPEFEDTEGAFEGRSEAVNARQCKPLARAPVTSSTASSSPTRTFRRHSNCRVARGAARCTAHLFPTAPHRGRAGNRTHASPTQARRRIMCR